MTAVKKVLIVEDEPALRDVYQLILQTHGFKTSTASNGTRGLIALSSFEPDLIILDLLMPDMDGITFLQNFDADAYPNTRIVVYSNLFDDFTKRTVLQLGALDILLKSSMTPSDLVKRVKQYTDD